MANVVGLTGDVLKSKAKSLDEDVKKSGVCVCVRERERERERERDLNVWCMLRVYACICAFAHVCV